MCDRQNEGTSEPDNVAGQIMEQEKKTQGGVFFVRRTCGTTKQTTVLTQVGGIKYNNNNIRKEITQDYDTCDGQGQKPSSMTTINH